MATSNQQTADVTGPHYALDESGNSYDYWRCESCGLESADPAMDSSGCPRCNGGRN